MDLAVQFAMPGVEPREHHRDGRPLSLRLGTLDEVQHGFQAGPDRIAETRLEDGTLAASVDAAADHGYLLFALDFGHASLSPDGRQAVICPARDQPPWIWQRFLTGQLLPLAALLRGLEGFHACALGLDAGAIALVAHSTIGKTTTALHLALRGLDFISDDVLVVEPGDAGVIVHPALGLANLRAGSAALLAELERSRLATVVGHGERETRITLRGSGAIRPLSALFLLGRYPEPRRLEIERLAPVDPRVLLASTFNSFITAPERLTRQLDLCARIARSAAVFRVSLGSEVSPGELADAVLEEAGRRSSG